MPPKVISGGDNPYDIHDAKLSSSATAHESSSVTAHEISNISHRKALLFKFHVDISTRYFITQVSRGSSQLAANCALYRLA